MEAVAVVLLAGLFSVVVVVLEVLRDRQQAANVRLLADSVAAVAESVGKAVQTATTPPYAPVSVPERGVSEGEEAEMASIMDSADPTDGVRWLFGAQDGPFAVMGPPLSGVEEE